MQNEPSLNLSPTNDVYFKLLFGDERNIKHLEAFLKTVLDLPPGELDHITLADPNLKREFDMDKAAVLDIKVYTRSDRVIDVEIQVEKDEQMRNRIVLYIGKMLTEQIKRGEEYSKIRQVISLVIADFDMVPEEKEYINYYTLINRKSGRLFTNMIEIVTLELKKLPEADDGNPAWPWLKFMKCRTKEEMAMLVETNPEMLDIVCEYSQLTEDQEARYWAERRERFLRAQHDREEEAVNRGLKRGMEQGLQQGMEKGIAIGEQKILALFKSGKTVEEVERIIKEEEA
jgi:predicted transposase/invertase (TIGR01784 family)